MKCFQICSKHKVCINFVYFCGVLGAFTDILTIFKSAGRCSEVGGGGGRVNTRCKVLTKHIHIHEVGSQCKSRKLLLFMTRSYTEMTVYFPSVSSISLPCTDLKFMVHRISSYLCF